MVIICTWSTDGQLTIDFQLVTHLYHVEFSLALIIFPRNHHDGPHVPRSICGCPIGLILWWEMLFFVRYSVLIHLFELFSQRVHPLVSPLHLKMEKNFLSSVSKVYTDESNQMVPSHLLRNWIFSSKISWLETTSLILWEQRNIKKSKSMVGKWTIHLKIILSWTLHPGI